LDYYGNTKKNREANHPSLTLRIESRGKMRTSELRLKILQIVQRGDCYGYEIHKKLSVRGIDIDLGRLYKVLTQMLTDGLVACRWENSGKGPKKRVYKLADKGATTLNTMLREAIDIIHEHYSEYLLSLPTTTSVFEALSRIAAPDLMRQCKIGFFAQNPSPVHERIFASLRTRLPESEVYAIQPNGINLSLNIKNVVCLHGGYESIPVREKHLALLIIEGLPRSQNMLRAAEEWHRVIRENGRLLLIAPTALFSSLEDPLSIGDFIEKIEHKSSGELSNDGEVLVSTLKSLFQKVDTRHMLQMTLLIAAEPL
jgi:DNA-binding PadR family transcriptional regulator